jgi:hypothetical protein
LLFACETIGNIHAIKKNDPELEWDQKSGLMMGS